MILQLAVSLVAVAGFGVVLWLSRIVAVSRAAMTATMAGLSAMTDPALDDDSKEIAVRRAGLRLIGVAFAIFWRFAAALAAAYLCVLLGAAAGLVEADAVVALMLRWEYIVAVSLGAIALGEVLRRSRPRGGDVGDAADRYSAADRIAHVVAFSSPTVLKAASAIEDSLLRRARRPPTGPPIFVTSLARGGTTALLTALHDVPGVATHTYRDMPFVTAPILWNRLAGGRGRGVARHQRAHGDGLEIDLDSPEALEEIVWTLFWPAKFDAATIGLWRGDETAPAMDGFLTRHMAKIVRARLGADGDEPARYCSKNNANIARLAYLAKAFPEAHFVIPVRHPERHAASLLRQHRNFLALHAENDFVRRYMRDIGHFEFGAIHKPIGFDGFDPARHDPQNGDYWLDYWIHAFREVLRHADRCRFVLQEDLRAAPQATMTRLCADLGLEPGALAFDGYYRTDPDTPTDEIFSATLREEADAIYREIGKIVSARQ